MSWCEGLEAPPRLLIGPESSSSEDRAGTPNTEGLVLSLLHPRSGNPTCYFLVDGSLKELQWFKQSYGSWFLGDYVCEDGSLYICTPVDPIFILLPLFEDARMQKGSDKGMFRQLSEILYIDGYPGYQQLISLAKDSMSMVCEVKDAGSSEFFRLDNSKVLAWLSCKVQHLKGTLFSLDANYAAQEERDTLKEVISILGEYLKDEPWLTLLCGHFKLNIQDIHKEPPKHEADLTYIDATSVSSPSQGNLENGKNMSSSKKPAKKQKMETNSHNIKDMFRRVTRKRT